MKAKEILQKHIDKIDIAFISAKQEILPDLEILSNHSGKLIVATMGAEGSIAYFDGTKYSCKAVEVEDVIDTTGCGDAYRSGLLYGLMRDMDWEMTGRIASLMGAIKIEHAGTQNHKFTQHEFAQRFQAAFGMSLA